MAGRDGVPDALDQLASVGCLGERADLVAGRHVGIEQAGLQAPGLLHLPAPLHQLLRSDVGDHRHVRGRGGHAAFLALDLQARPVPGTTELSAEATGLGHRDQQPLELGLHHEQPGVALRTVLYALDQGFRRLQAAKEAGLEPIGRCLCEQLLDHRQGRALAARGRVTRDQDEEASRMGSAAELHMRLRADRVAEVGHERQQKCCRVGLGSRSQRTDDIARQAVERGIAERGAQESAIRRDLCLRSGLGGQTHSLP